MKVLLAEKYGFCFGVEGAIELAERTLAERKHVYSLGQIIHNRQVVERLAAKGLRVVEEPAQIVEPNATVLIRSHGIRPEIEQQLRQRGLEVVDATCVLVKRAQNIVRQLHDEGYQVVLIGDAKHPEVLGVVGYAPQVIVISGPEQLQKLTKRARLGIVGQTTINAELFGRTVGAIASADFKEIKVINTLCPEVMHRQRCAVELARQVDVMFVLGGANSANTRHLAELCRQHVRTYHLQGWEQFDPRQVAGASVAGLTAGASTPKWLVQQFLRNLQAFQPSESS